MSVALVAAAACATASQTPASGSTTTAPARSAGPNDAQIAAIVVAANSVDIENGKLARSKSWNPLVQEFADQMINDHGQVNREAGALVQKLNVTPEENETSRSLTAGGQTNLNNLRGLQGAEFDRAYVDNEVAYHEAVLKAVDEVLIPNAKNEELKSLLVNVRPTFVGHLQHAKNVQAYLAGKSASAR